MKKYRNKIIAGISIALVLVIVYWWGGNSPGLKGSNSQEIENTNIAEMQTEYPAAVNATEPISSNDGKDLSKKEAEEKPVTESESVALEDKAAKEEPSNIAADDKHSESSSTEINQAVEDDKYQAELVPEDRPTPIEPSEAVISDKKLTCTLSVRCDTILQNIAWLDAEKVPLVPKDGVIFAERAVTFYEGESVFNLLVREMKQNKIHMEFENTPVYNSAYIEGIGNIYEFDCGELSGWMYKVNGWFPNYGCSRYQLKAGDKVELVYTCNLGADVGGQYSARNGK